MILYLTHHYHRKGGGRGQARAGSRGSRSGSRVGGVDQIYCYRQGAIRHLVRVSCGIENVIITSHAPRATVAAAAHRSPHVPGAQRGWFEKGEAGGGGYKAAKATGQSRKSRPEGGSSQSQQTHTVATMREGRQGGTAPGDKRGEGKEKDVFTALKSRQPSQQAGGGVDGGKNSIGPRLPGYPLGCKHLTEGQSCFYKDATQVRGRGCSAQDGAEVWSWQR